MKSFTGSRRSLFVESLENRWLMAGNVMARQLGEVLLITGDSKDNAIEISLDQNNRVVVSAADAQVGFNINKPTRIIQNTINGFSGVEQVVITLAGGNDALIISELDVDGDVTIDTGKGNDRLLIGGLSDSVPTDVVIGGGLYISTGGGNDRVNEYRLRVEGDQVLVTDTGNDIVSLELDLLADTPDDDDPIDGFATGGVSVEGNFAISLGTGNDQLFADDLAVEGMLMIFDPTGNDTVALNRVVAQDCFVDVGLATRAKGVDRVTITNAEFETLDVALGFGNDVLTVGNTDVTDWAYFDGGFGLDRYIDEGDNNFNDVFGVFFEL
jgi:hypothetical protein